MQTNRQLVADDMVKPSLEGLIKSLHTEMSHVKQQIKNHTNNHPYMKRNKELLETIPGFGEILSVSFLAYVGNITKFSSVKSLVCYAG
jgi:transposase